MRDDDDDDRPQTKKRTTADRPPTALFVGGAVAGLLALVGIGVAVVLIVAGNKAQPGGLRPDVTGLPGGAGVVLDSGDTPPPARWVTFKHPEGLYTAKVPVTPIEPEPPEGGSVFAPPQHGFANSTRYTSFTRDLNITLEVRVFTPLGLENDRKSDARLGAAQFGHDAVRTDVKWAGHDAVEDREMTPTQRAVRRRLYLGNRLYQVTVYGDSGHPTEADLAALFDSFVPHVPE